MNRNNTIIFIFLAGLAGLFLVSSAGYGGNAADRYFNNAKNNPPLMQAFLRAFPKGGDLHNHLSGAVYAESFINWAANDDLCVDEEKLAINKPETGKNCIDSGWVEAETFAESPDAVAELIDNISMRDFVPTSGWSGHNQFFSTFNNTTKAKHRFGDMIAESAARAGAQNISYLELMTSLRSGDLFGNALQTTWDNQWNNDIGAGYVALMAGPFGQNLETLIANEIALMDAMDARRDALLGCGTASPDVGCGVEIRYLYQVIRTVPQTATFAGFIMGFELAKRDSRVVGMNLVAPEDHPLALEYYDLHMGMIDFLWNEKWPIDISLHAGELALGLVMPKHLRSHIRDAIDVGHAKRIGHGMDIAYEDRPMELLAQMRESDIMVEINLTSNDVILGVKGDEHPILLYELAGVPYALSTDDEGVSRIDLTHEYNRAVMSYDLSYGDIKQLSRNSINYSFLNPADKALLMADLEQRFAAFEAEIKTWPQP